MQAFWPRIDVDRLTELSYPPALMFSVNRAVALYLIAVFSTCLGADDIALEPQDGVLVLRNGFVLQGRITPINDVFLVTMGASGEIRLPRAEVEFQGRDLDDAYRHQRDALPSDEITAHLQLADWCLRHGLISRAADQLLVVFTLEPSNARLSAMENRLLSLGAKRPATTNSAGKLAAEISQPATSRLPPQMLQQFSTVIQPILLNRCATHTCHGNGSTTQFRLIRPALGHSPTSRMTHRNLQAMFSLMDHQHPEESAVLTQAISAHGGAKVPPFTEKHQNQLELVEAWVRRAAATPPAAIVANSGGPNRAREPASSSKSPVTPANFDAATNSKAEVIPATDVPHSSTAPPALRHQVEESAGRDPFDPQIFNRRYHPEPTETATPAGSSGR